MTPAEWTTFVQGWVRREEREERRALTFAWLAAKLTRIDEFPSLEALTTPPVEAVELSDEETARQAAFMKLIEDKLAAKKAREQKARDEAARG